MAGSISCRLHQALGYANTRLGIGMGCCQLDGDYTTCNGDVGFCEKPDLLIHRIVRNIENSAAIETRLSHDVTFVSFGNSIGGDPER